MYCKSRKDWTFVLFMLFLYFGAAFYALRSSLDLNGLVSAVLNFYGDFGLEVDRHIVRALVISLSFSCVFHAFLIFFDPARGERPTAKFSGFKVIIYLLFKVVFFMLFCVFVAGALGDNVSSKRLPLINKEFSVLLGGLVLGGVVWLVNDFISALYNNIIGRFK
jgi:hypothetical protein